MCLPASFCCTSVGLCHLSDVWVYLQESQLDAILETDRDDREGSYGPLPTRHDEQRTDSQPSDRDYRSNYDADEQHQDPNHLLDDRRGSGDGEYRKSSNSEYNKYSKEKFSKYDSGSSKSRQEHDSPQSKYESEKSHRVYDDVRNNEPLRQIKITVKEESSKREVDIEEPTYEYYDGGNHWCRLCNEVCSNVYELFAHLQNKKHMQVSHAQFYFESKFILINPHFYFIISLSLCTRTIKWKQ